MYVPSLEHKSSVSQACKPPHHWVFHCTACRNNGTHVEFKPILRTSFVSSKRKGDNPRPYLYRMYRKSRQQSLNPLFFYPSHFRYLILQFHLSCTWHSGRIIHTKH